MKQSIHQSAPAITGMGCISPLGLGVEAQVRAIAEDRVGLAAFETMEQAEAVRQESLIGGECRGLDDVAIQERAARGLSLAVREALNNAAVDTASPPYAPKRIAAVLGTSLHGMNAAGAWLRGASPKVFDSFLAGNILEQALAGTPVGGLRATCSSACASALSSIGHARTLLESNAADMVLCGGYDPISEYSVAGFHSLRVVSPDRLRPFAEGRLGMQVSEGYAVLILERAEDAERRGQPIRAIVAGIGESSDAHHLTQPDPKGAGAAAVMRDALADAHRQQNSIGLIVAHATGTRDNDAAEAQAVRRVFGDDGPAVTALKSRVGHTLGAAGALEATITRASLDAGWLPTTANVDADAIGEPVRLATGKPLTIERSPQHVMSCSLGFGGANAAVIQSLPADPSSPQPASARREVFDVAIKGIGVVLPGALGPGLPSDDSLWETGTIDPAALRPHLPRGKARRLSPLSRIALTATKLAFEHAEIDPHRLPGLDASPDQRPACLVATANGTGSFAYDYYKELVEEGYKTANPLMFAEGVPNAPAAHVSMFHRLHGTSQSIIGTHTCGLDALALATLRIASGRWSTAAVCLAEEDHPLVREMAHGCGQLAKDAPPHEGAIALILGRLDRAASTIATLEQPQAISSTRTRETLVDFFTDPSIKTHFTPTDRRHQRALVADGHQPLAHGPWFGLATGLSLLHALNRSDPNPCRVAAACPTGLVSSLIMKTLCHVKTSTPAT
ncbi:MAG: beta-ketoacyl synthase N-terminal-like domain-containing protein [Phycisphaeraceae bacterium]